MYVYIYIYIQGVSRLYVITAGGDFLGICDQKVHINMCPILDGYEVTGIFQLPYTPWCEPRRNQLVGDLGGLSLCQLSRQPSSRP
jgi:hypothetical protein